MPTRLMAVYGDVHWVGGALPGLGPGSAPLVGVPGVGAGGVAVRPEVAEVVDTLALVRPEGTLLVSVGGEAGCKDPEADENSSS